MTLTGGAVTVGTQGLIVTGGSDTFSGTQVSNDGTIEVHDGTLKITGSITGSGSVQIDSGAAFDLDGSDAQNIVFAGAGAELEIDAATFGGNIAGLAATDELDLRTIGYSAAGTSGTYVSNSNNDGGVLTITDGSKSISMTLVGDYRHAHFAGASDGHGGTLITLKAADDAPVFVAADKAQTATVTELSLTTNSSVQDPLSPVTGAIHFTDIDLTDRPAATITHQSVTWTTADHLTVLSLNDSQTNALEYALSLVQTNNTNSGAIGWSYSITDSALDFLADGQTATIVSTVTLNDNEGGTDTATVTITVTGTNDLPVITGSSQTGSITEISGALHSTSSDTAIGAVTFTDADLSDTHTVTVTCVTAAGVTSGLPSSSATLQGWLSLGSLTDSGNGAIGSDAWSFSAQDKNFDYLAAGEQVKLTYTVQVADNHGGTTTQNVDVIITGTNDAPEITSSAQTGSITECAGVLGSTSLDTASGAVKFTDADLSDTHMVTVTGVTASGATSGLPDNSILASWLSLGTLTDSGNGATGSDAWSFSALDKNFDYLAAGEQVKLTYTVQVADNHGGTAIQHVDVTITGTNDAPAIVGETDPATQTVVVVNPVVPIVLAQGVNTNSLGLHTETFNDQSPGSSSNNGQGFGKFDSEALDATFSGSGHAGVVNGSSSVSAAPFVGPGPGVADTTNYLSVGAGGTETITFDDEQNAFGLYWGSVDSYNTISFYHGATLVASYTGADVTPLFPTGNQGSFSSNGYVEFAGLASFDKVVLGTGNSNAFEIDNISAGTVLAPHVELAAPITGTLTVSDADIGDTLTASVIGNAVLEYNGSTTIPGNVDVSGLIASKSITFDSVKSDGGQDVLHWTYDPTNPNLDFLKSGDTLTITYAAQVNDGHGNIGSKPLTVTIAGTTTSANPSQSQVLNGTSQNDTFNNIGHNETIFGAGGHDTFVFKPGFGSATIGDFDVNNDTINIDPALVTSLSAFLASAQPANSNQDTILTDAAHETITLKGVTVAQLQVHQGDFHVI